MDDSIQTILTQEMSTLKTDLQQASRQQASAAGSTDDPGFNFTVEGNTATMTGPAAGTTSGDNFQQLLQEWIQARHITIRSQDELERVATFLRWWIQQNGTAQFAATQPANPSTNPYATPIAAFNTRLNARVTQYFTNQIQTQTQKALK